MPLLKCRSFSYIPIHQGALFRMNIELDSLCKHQIALANAKNTIFIIGNKCTQETDFEPTERTENKVKNDNSKQRKSSKTKCSFFSAKKKNAT